MAVAAAAAILYTFLSHEAAENNTMNGYRMFKKSEAKPLPCFLFGMNINLARGQGQRFRSRHILEYFSLNGARVKEFIDTTPLA